jgi:hypothetical protein
MDATDFPLKPYTFKGYTVSFRNGQWVAVKDGKQVYANDSEKEIQRFLSNYSGK